MTQHTLMAQLVELQEENARLREDAERYRWLRDQYWVEQEATFRLGLSDTEFLNKYHEELDAAIDAARKEQK